MKGNKAKTFLILSVFLCFVLGIVIYMYIYVPQVEKTEQLENANIALASRVEVLMAFNEKMPENLAQIDKMTAEIKERLKDFPAEVREEDIIALALKSWEEEILVAYQVLSFDEDTLLASVPAKTVQGAGIEGMDRELQFISKGATYSGMTKYEELKDLVTCFNANQEELAISEVSFGTDVKGEQVEVPVVLHGYVKTTFYSVAGTDKEYVPREFSEYEIGLMDLFDVSKFASDLSIIPEELRSKSEEAATEQ